VCVIVVLCLRCVEMETYHAANRSDASCRGGILCVCVLETIDVVVYAIKDGE
jgi:hypothetical protein